MKYYVACVGKKIIAEAEDSTAVLAWLEMYEPNTKILNIRQIDDTESVDDCQVIRINKDYYSY